MSKYKAKKIKVDDMVFDSKREYKHWLLLNKRLENNEIRDLQRQVKFILIPAQYEELPPGPRGGVKKKLLEREVSYVADFTYYTTNDDKFHVVDSKGVRTPDYIIKRKLLLYTHGHHIEEV